MTMFHGLGMFFLGIGATLVGGLIVWWVINNFVIEEDEKKR